MSNLIEIKGREYDFYNKTYIMGILNITPDSFSDGGRYLSPKKALERAREMVVEGADIIDIGGESSRPGAEEVSVEEELKRILPVVEVLVKELDIPISIDTTKYEVAKRCLELGANIINDVSGLKDERILDIIREYKGIYILMHTKGTPKTMSKLKEYDDLLEDITLFFKRKIECILKRNLLKDQVILDPGIGFAKGKKENIKILKNIKKIQNIGYPILVGTSRKKFIKDILGKEKSEDTIHGNTAITAYLSYNRIGIIRVHDVKENKETLKIISEIND